MSKEKGNITVNNREAKDYFTTGTLMYKLNQPFGLVEAEGQYDVKVNVSGGGITGQVEAVRLAIARALCEVSEDNRPALKAEGLMTRILEWLNVKNQTEESSRNSNSANVNIEGYCLVSKLF